jgi:NADPH-dependent curcumin reductase CurA
MNSSCLLHVILLIIILQTSRAQKEHNSNKNNSNNMSSSKITTTPTKGEFVTNRKWILAQHPEGAFSAERDAKLEEEKIYLDELSDDEAVIQVHSLGIDGFLRTMLDPVDADRDAFHGASGVGKPIPALGMGTVIKCTSGKYKEGALVMGMMGGQTIARAPVSQLNPVMKLPNVPLNLSLNLLGLSGLTAYAGINFVLKPPKKGDTVVISAAAGATGSIAAQLCKLKGARVVGIAGGPAKNQFLLNELKLDAAVDYKDPNKSLEDQLDEACPDGIDFFFDNVGGELLDAVLDRINKRARIVICGAVSQYDNMHDKKRIRGPSNYLSIAEKTATMAGYVVLEFGAKLILGYIAMLWYFMRGKLKNYSHEYEGIDSFPEALQGLYAGKSTGKPVVNVSKF